jgi:hypothetical protein
MSQPLYPRGKKAPFKDLIGGWVDPRDGLDDVEKRNFLNILRLELRPIGPSSSDITGQNKKATKTRKMVIYGF